MFQVNTHIRFSDFQSKLELLMTEVLPFTDEVLVDLVHKCFQHFATLDIALRDIAQKYSPDVDLEKFMRD